MGKRMESKVINNQRMRNMKRFTLPLLIILLLTSCESQENKSSRLTLDKYTRKLNSMATDIISSRDEEGSQSRLTLNRFYDRYTSKFEDFNNDLDFETISEKYSTSRNELTNIARTYYVYLNTRKRSIVDMSDASSAYERAQDYAEDYEEYMDKMISSSYNSDFYYEMATKSSTKKFEKQLEFILSSSSYIDQLEVLDSLVISIDSISMTYNNSVEELKLTEKIVVPETLNDTINDWLITSKKYILQLIDKEN